METTYSKYLKQHMNKLRASIVSTYPHEKCGVAYYTFGLVNEMSKLINLQVIANKTDHPIRDSTINNINVVKCWKRDSIFYPIPILISCIKFRGNIVHLQYNYSLYGKGLSALMFPVLLIGLKLTNKTLVVTMHGIIPKSKLRRELFQRYGLGTHMSILKRALMIILVKSIILLSNAVIVHNIDMKECLIQDYGANSNKVFIVPHGVRITSSLEYKNAKALLGLRNQKIILYQGFITEGKGVEILIQAFGQVNQIDHNTLLVIAGGFRREDDRYAQFIRSLIMEKSLTESITVTGFVPEEKLPLYFFASDIIVLPYTETDILGSSEVLAEVALVGKPIIATSTPKLLGLLRDGHNALLVRPKSSEKLANAILSLLSDEQTAKRLAKTLREEALSRTWNKVASKTVSVYKKLVEFKQ